MEATGVYWKLVWYVPEGRLELILSNAMHAHNLPGRKSDVNDALWIADLLAHGLVRASFVPPSPILELRDLARTRHGAPWLKAVMVQAAWAGSRKRDSYLKAPFLRLKSRRGPKKAILAVAATMMVAVYHMLRDGVEYEDLSADYFDRPDTAKVAQRLLRRLQELGVHVQIETAVA